MKKIFCSVLVGYFLLFMGGNSIVFGMGKVVEEQAPNCPKCNSATQTLKRCKLYPDGKQVLMRDYYCEKCKIYLSDLED